MELSIQPVFILKAVTVALHFDNLSRYVKVDLLIIIKQHLEHPPHAACYLFSLDYNSMMRFSTINPIVYVIKHIHHYIDS